MVEQLLEIKSHGFITPNERLAILIYLLENSNLKNNNEKLKLIKNIWNAKKSCILNKKQELYIKELIKKEEEYLNGRN